MERDLQSADDRMDAAFARPPNEGQLEKNSWRENSANTRAKVPTNWPALFGPERNSVADGHLNPIWPEEGPKLVWQTEVGTGYGSPVTSENRVVFNHRVGDEEIVQCHDANTGKLHWEFRFPTSAVCDFEYSNGPYSTPVIDVVSRQVFCVGAQGQMHAINFDTGQVVWSRELHREYAVKPDIFPVGASPFLDQGSGQKFGQLIFGLGASSSNAGIIALDCETGVTRWEATDHGPSYATPVVANMHGQRFVFVVTDIGLVSLDPDTGTIDWEIKHFRRGDLTRNATSPMVHGDEVLVVCSGAGGLNVEILPDRSYRESWRQRRTIDSQYNTLIGCDGHVFSFTSAGQGGAEFRCVALSDGELVWRYRSVLGRGMAFATAESFFILGERGHLASMVRSANQPTVISFSKEPLMQEPCYCSPAISGRLLVLKDEERLAVFDCGE